MYLYGFQDKIQSRDDEESTNLGPQNRFLVFLNSIVLMYNGQSVYRFSSNSMKNSIPQFFIHNMEVFNPEFWFRRTN